jgi:hypothetical protein
MELGLALNSGVEHIEIRGKGNIVLVSRPGRVCCTLRVVFSDSSIMTGGEVPLYIQ